MPTLKNRMIFISHAWQYSEHYRTVVKWLKEEPNFSWSNCSVPEHDPVDGNLSEALLKQLRPAQAVVILGGMYASHSEWIDWEVKQAHRMGKTLIGVQPWGNTLMPRVITDHTPHIVGWNRGPLVSKIRSLT